VSRLASSWRVYTRTAIQQLVKVLLHIRQGIKNEGVRIKGSVRGKWGMWPHKNSSRLASVVRKESAAGCSKGAFESCPFPGR